MQGAYVQHTGMTKAGEILLLVGGILRCVAGAVLLLLAFLVGGILSNASQSSSDKAGAHLAAAIVVPLYIVLGILVAVGGVLGIMGYSKARQGNLGSAFVFGLVGCLLPPVDILMLLGAIFVKMGQNQPPQPVYPYPPQYPPQYPPPYPPQYPPQAPPPGNEGSQQVPPRR